jgi:hypothetical protein
MSGVFSQRTPLPSAYVIRRRVTYGEATMSSPVAIAWYDPMRTLASSSSGVGGA